MEGLFYLLAVSIACGVLVWYSLRLEKKNKEKEELRKERDKKVIALCNYLMSEPNYEREVKNNEGLYQELSKE